MIRPFPRLLVGTAVLLSASAAGTAVDPQDAFAPLRPEHHEAVRAEREERVRDAWAEAPAARREQVLRLFVLDPAHGSATRRFDLDTLAAAERVLSGKDVGLEPDPHAAFLAQLDVRPVPGAFVARDAGLGEPITAHVELLAETHVPEEIVIGLDWVAPDGRRQRARTEGFSRELFGEGLEMYLRPPAGDPADWRLAPLLVLGERELRAPGVRVPCYGSGEDVRERIADAAEGSRAVPLTKLRDDLDGLRDHGLRSTCDASVSQRLAHFGLAGGSDWPHPYGWHAFGDEDRLGAWGIAPTGETRGAVLLVTDGRRDDTSVFAGVLAKRWRAFADARGRLVISVACGGSETESTRLAALLRELSAGDFAPPVVVLTGDAVIVAPPVLRDLGHGALDRVLLAATPTVGRGVRLALDAPVLGLAHGQAEEEDVCLEPPGDHPGGERWWIRRRVPDFLAALEVPELLGRWIDGEL